MENKLMKLKKKDMIYMVFIFLSPVLILILIEFAFRLFLPPYTRSNPSEGIYLPDKTFGHRMVPGFTGRRKHEEFDIEIKINSFGMREEEVAKDKNYFTILNIGDSFTYGYGLKREETIAYKIGSDLAGHTLDKKRIRSLNAGVTGYGSLNSFYFLKELFNELEPELAIYYLFIGNDATDDLALLAGKNKDIHLNKNYGQAAKDFLQNNSAFYDFIFKRLKNSSALSRLFLTTGIRGVQSYLYKENDSFYNMSFGLLKENVKKMQGYLRDKNAGLIVVIIPEDIQVLYSDILRGKKLNPVKPQDDITSFLKNNNIHYIDLLPDLQKEGRQLYFNFDSHFNPQGSQFVAKIVSDYILLHKNSFSAN